MPITIPSGNGYTLCVYTLHTKTPPLTFYCRKSTFDILAEQAFRNVAESSAIPLPNICGDTRIAIIVVL